MQLSWKNSVPSPRQRALKHTLIEARVDPALPWSMIGIVVVPGIALAIDPSIAPGDWTFRATEVDVGNIASTNQPTVAVSIGFDAPSGVSELAFHP